MIPHTVTIESCKYTALVNKSLTLLSPLVSKCLLIAPKFCPKTMWSMKWISSNGRSWFPAITIFFLWFSVPTKNSCHIIRRWIILIINVIKITSLTRSPLPICRGVGDLKKSTIRHMITFIFMISLDIHDMCQTHVMNI